jgi:hypothetical protein
MKTSASLTFALLLLIAASCSGQHKNSAGSSSELSIPEPAGEEVREMGLVKSAEDSGYPFFNLTIEFPERQFEETFLLNLEAIEGLDPAVLNSWKDRYVVFNYTSTLTNMLYDLRMEGASLLEMTDSDLPEGIRKFTGVLSGAGEITAGDLPSVITVNDPHGESLDFEYFVTEDMTRAEGQLVEVFFEVRTQNSITAIQQVNK